MHTLALRHTLASLDVAEARWLGPAAAKAAARELLLLERCRWRACSGDEDDSGGLLAVVGGEL